MLCAIDGSLSFWFYWYYRVPMHLKKIIFHTFSIPFSILNLRSSIPFFSSFFEILNHETEFHTLRNTALIMKYLQWNSARILEISLSFRISILFQYLMYILAKFNTFSRSWKPILKLNTSSILSILRGNPGISKKNFFKCKSKVSNQRFLLYYIYPFTVPSPRGALVSLFPQTKYPSANWNMKHYNSVEILQ